MPADLDKELKTALVEEYANEEPPSDGEIYCKIRQYQRERDLYSENRWRARLSKHGTKCLEQLFRHRALTAAFDDLLDIHGLWKGMRLSTLDKMIGMRCDEVILPLDAVPSLLIRSNRKSCATSPISKMSGSRSSATTKELCRWSKRLL